MQVVNRTYVLPIAPSHSAGGRADIPIALKAMLQRIASSTQLSLAQKRSFSDAIKNAYETGNGKLMVKIMMAVAQAEAQSVDGRYRPHSLNEILVTGQTDRVMNTPNEMPLFSGQERLRQLLFS